MTRNQVFEWIGEIINYYKKAKKILDGKIKEKDPGSYYLLYGKIYRKEKKKEEVKEAFKKSISYENIESIYEYGKLIFKEESEIH